MPGACDLSGRCIFRGRVAQAFDLAGAKNIVGAPSFAYFAKGGNLACATGLQSHKNCVGSLVTRPCKKRKDGAPSAPLAHTDIIEGWALGNHFGARENVHSCAAASHLLNSKP